MEIGVRYEGDFYEDNRKGKGIVHYPDGARFEGEYNGNSKCLGMLYLADGKIYEQEYVNGELIKNSEI